MWRRVCGGLSGGLQLTLFNRLRPTLLPTKGKNVAKPVTSRQVDRPEEQEVASKGPIWNTWTCDRELGEVSQAHLPLLLDR